MEPTDHIAAEGGITISAIDLFYKFLICKHCYSIFLFALVKAALLFALPVKKTVSICLI